MVVSSSDSLGSLCLKRLWVASECSWMGVDRFEVRSVADLECQCALGVIEASSDGNVTGGEADMLKLAGIEWEGMRWLLPSSDMQE
jgi:hypothetical protein